MELIILEGLNNVTVNNQMKILKDRLTKENKKVDMITFPRYEEKSGALVKNHLYEFPKPNFDTKYSFDDVLNFDNEKLLFVNSKNPFYMFLLEIIRIDKRNKIIYAKSVINNEHLTILESDDYIFYKAINNNVFNWRVKASHTTKALFYTVDRNIWFANNENRINDLDYLIINRSYMSNFLYRTVEIKTPEEFLEYVISIYRIEILANDIQDTKIHNFYFYSDNFEAELEYQKKYYLENDIDNIANLKREEQYLKTINNNFPHLLDLIRETDKKYPDLFKKYKKYLNIDFRFIGFHNITTDYISNYIFDKIL